MFVQALKCDMLVAVSFVTKSLVSMLGHSFYNTGTLLMCSSMTSTAACVAYSLAESDLGKD